MKRYGWLILSAIILAGWFSSAAVQAQSPVVHVVFFYSPSCPHCHRVMEDDFPPLMEKYGDRLQILKLDVSQPQMLDLWKQAMDIYQPELQGVPMLLIGDHVLVGDQEIPQQLPGLIEQYLADGGVDWPDLPGLSEIAAQGETPETPAAPTVWDKIARDPVGNTLSILVLLGLIASLVLSLGFSTRLRPLRRFTPGGVFVLIAIGMIAASYLSYVETTHTPAVCGPVGDCNTVQQSEYCMLLGFMPVAVFGLIGYVLILASYGYARWGKKYADYAPAVVFLLVLFGVAFSTYLTFLEPFVIGATCAWCLTSAVCMTLLLLLTAEPGWESISKLKRQRGR